MSDTSTEQALTTPPGPVSPIIPSTRSQKLFFSIAGNTYPAYSSPGYLIGRGDVCDIKVNDQQVSTRHCHIKDNTLIDCRSTNGTSVNGDVLPPHQPHNIKPGDLVYIGSTEITFEYKDVPLSNSTDAITSLDLSGLSNPPAEPHSPTSSSTPANPLGKLSAMKDMSKGNKFGALGRVGPTKTPFVGLAPGPLSQQIPISQSQSSTSSSQPTLSNDAFKEDDYTDSNGDSSDPLNQTLPLTTTTTPPSTTSPNQPATFSQSLQSLPAVDRFGRGNNNASLTPAAVAEITAAASTSAFNTGPGPVVGQTGVPTTAEILGAEPHVQKAHIEFLRSEIFRLRRSNLLEKKGMDRKKPGLIGGSTSGGDNADIFKEVIDLKKQMTDIKFILLYGEDQDLISAGMASNDLSFMSKDDHKGKDGGDGDGDGADQNNSLLERVRDLEAQLARKSQEITTIQATNDVNLTQTQDKFQGLLASKDEEMKGLVDSFEKELKGTKDDYEGKIMSVQTIADTIQDQCSGYIEQLNVLQDRINVLENNEKRGNNNNDWVEEKTKITAEYKNEISNLQLQLGESDLKLIELKKAFENLENEKIKLQNEAIIIENLNKSLLEEKEREIEQKKLWLEEEKKNVNLEKNKNENIDQNIVMGTDTTNIIDIDMNEKINLVKKEHQIELNEILVKNDEKIQKILLQNNEKNNQILSLQNSLSKLHQNEIELESIKSEKIKLQNEFDLFRDSVQKNNCHNGQIGEIVPNSEVSQDFHKVEKEYQTKLAESQNATTKINSLLTSVLTTIIQDDINLTPQEKKLILENETQREKFIKTDSFKHSLFSAKKSHFSPTETNGKEISTTMVDPDPVQIIKDLPPQALALIAGPAALLAALIVLLFK